jgi:hypothetical protein
MNNTTKSILSLLLIFFSFILSLTLPLISPILGVALLLGGIFTYRNNKNPAVRRIAVIAIASGITIILILIFTLLFLTTIHTTTTISVIQNNSLKGISLNGNTSISAPFFPVANNQSEFSMTALLGGELVLEDGCLRVKNGHDNYLIVWPHGFSLSTEGGVIQVIDDTGQPIARVGDRVKIGGGECVKPCKHIAIYSTELPSDRCSGPYWIVGEVIAKQPHEEDKEKDELPPQSKNLTI